MLVILIVVASRETELDGLRDLSLIL